MTYKTPIMPEISMALCSTCKGIFTGPQLLRQEQPHNELREHYVKAAEDGCYICRIIVKSEGWKGIDPASSFGPTWSLTPQLNRPPGWLKLVIDAGTWEDEEETDVSVSSDEAQAMFDASLRPDFRGSEGIAGGFALQKPPLWSFLLQPLSDVEKNIGAYVPPPGFESPSMLDIAVHWLSECQSNHAACRVKKPGFYPTRLLEIMTDNTLRVIITLEQPPDGVYASLSHCWGTARTLKLLQSNIDQLRVQIKIDDVPKSYREAIAVCSRFQFRYIWIDSLCIIQDSHEDWEREAVTMKDVYQNSVMNIAAAAAVDSSYASFESRDLSTLKPLKIETEWEAMPKAEYYLQDNDMYSNEIETCPLRQRAWVLQEVFLTPRTLNLTKSQLWWECRELEACESYPNGLPSAWSGGPKEESQGRFRDAAHAYKRWNRLVESYSECHLTVLQDKMIAFSGLAQHFHDYLRDDEYVAGLWRSQLSQSLCWTTYHSRPCYRPATYRAPSWSWASIEGPVEFQPGPESRHTDLRSLCIILDVAVHTNGPSNTSTVSGGYIRVRGHLTKVGNLNNHISVPGPDGSWNYIKGSDEDLRRAESNNWSDFHFDECSPDDEIMISYLDNLDVNCCTSGQTGKATRVTKHWTAWEGSFFSLPLIEYHLDNRMVREGVILCRLQNWPTDICQRVASFTAIGSVIIDELARRGVEKAVTIL